MTSSAVADASRSPSAVAARCSDSATSCRWAASRDRLTRVTATASTASTTAITASTNIRPTLPTGPGLLAEYRAAPVSERSERTIQNGPFAHWCPIAAQAREALCTTRSCTNERSRASASAARAPRGVAIVGGMTSSAAACASRSPSAIAARCSDSATSRRWAASRDRLDEDDGDRRASTTAITAITNIRPTLPTEARALLCRVPCEGNERAALRAGAGRVPPDVRTRRDRHRRGRRRPHQAVDLPGGDALVHRPRPARRHRPVPARPRRLPRPRQRALRVPRRVRCRPHRPGRGRRRPWS